MLFNKIKQLAAISLLVCSGSVLAASHSAPSPSFKASQLTDSIYMLQGKGGNIALLKGEQGILLIDDDYKVMSDGLKKQVMDHGGLDKLTYIINTHWHGDHTQGNLALGPHASIIAHDNVRKLLSEKQSIKLFNMVSEPYPENALPSITYDKSMSLYFNNEAMKILHYPGGHTNGDSVVFFKKANIVHTGDLFFNGFFPFVDVDHGGDVLIMAANVKVILESIDENTKIIPGHGPLAKKAELQAFHDMLVGTAGEVQAMIDKGDKLPTIIKNGLSDKWAPWTKGFLSSEVWIGIVYESLTRKK